ncbi:MAG: endonuclease III [Clostridia bacterium]|nr:endonuclease III [Clostridia bacterium]
MTKNQATHIVEALERLYPDAICSLDSREPWQLLIAVRLSAQCTDARVNIVTKTLFEKFPTLSSLADAPIEEIEEIVKPCGLYKVKAQNIKETCRKLCDDFGQTVPDNMESLLTLPGVGRKTANLILGDVYGLPAVVCDTHCIRISNRLGMISVTDPYKAELALREILPPERSNDFCHRLVLFGREYCTARSPKCSKCPLAPLCPSDSASH